MLPEMRYEIASQRRHFRVSAPMRIQIGQHSYHAANWSLVDFKITGYAGTLQPGEETSVRVSIPYQGFEIAFHTNARIVRAEASDGSLIAEFTQLDEREREILEHFVCGLLRGEIEPVEGILRRLDLPVTPAMLKSDAPLTPAQLAAETRARRIGTVFYAIAGIVLSLVFTAVLYANLFSGR